MEGARQFTQAASGGVKRHRSSGVKLRAESANLRQHESGMITLKRSKPMVGRINSAAEEVNGKMKF